MPRSRFLAAILALTLPLLALDLGAKALAETALAGREPIELAGGFVVLVFARNRGAFLSLGGSFPPWAHFLFLYGLPSAALLGFGLWLLLRAPASRRLAILSAFFLAGGLGNMPERILTGSVRDYLNFGIGRLRTGILNIADLYLTIAVILAAIGWAGREREGDK